MNRQSIIISIIVLFAIFDISAKKKKECPRAEIKVGFYYFTGLPGLILEASESSGQHWFAATGIEKSDKEIIPIYKGHDYEKMTRKEMLKSQRYGKDHSGSLASALLGLNLGPDHINTAEEAKIDFLETDYHE